MSLHRLTLLPQPGGTEAQISRVPTPAPQPDRLPVEVVSVTRLAQGGRWRTEAMRSYDRPVLVWFTRGQGRLTISGRSSGYSPHNLVFLPPRTMHGFTTSGPVLGFVVFLPDGEEYDWPMEPLHLRLNEVQLQRELTGMIDAMQREADGKGLHSARALSCHAGLLSVWLARVADQYADAPNPSQATRLDTAAHRLAEAFTSLVERDFNRPDGVQHYAALLGVTPTHLSRVCRKIAGRPALDILTDRRHFEARRLLRDTDIRVAQVARHCGFASAAYFTRAFRSRTGQSPSEFRHGV
ncbi:helix-turn-helix domain-containing protein [Silicimonas algicola]|uniref:AraC-like DNA-binding protein n=1 Tax=Silicimonas algicola TaxID=1826607 RepID=A0A316G1H2_9RHOB|nr:AraC family transcriptional regulator [Silicimonas algicola]AZQ65847.1 helix-turn-helix domain-containing protein [Silicimonas algicola]PWK54771.1 AraC-like DNA-binding protein [Silicimonas algicola]